MIKKINKDKNMEKKKRNRKQLISTENYINRLFLDNSKLNVARFDLGYKKPFSNEITLEDANKDINKMLNNMRSKPSIFEHKKGYIIKREYTEAKGVHLHCVFFFDGNKILKDEHKVDKIGEYWNNEITKGRGSYHNCNRNTYKFEGTGMIDYKDTEKRKILLENVTSYLCEEKQSIESENDDKTNRAFTRGTLPKEKSNKGRPRSE